MDIQTARQGKAVIVKPRGRMDAATAPLFEQACDNLVQAGEKAWRGGQRRGRRGGGRRQGIGHGPHWVMEAAGIVQPQQAWPTAHAVLFLPPRLAA